MGTTLEVLRGRPYVNRSSTVSPPNGVFDRSRSGINGTFGAGAAAPTWTRLPSGRQVLSFNGAQYVDFGAIAAGSPLALGTSPVTVIATVLTTDIAATSYIVSNMSNTLDGEIGLLQVSPGAGGGFMFQRREGVNSYDFVQSTIALITNQFYRVAGVWTGATYQIFINGVLNNSSNVDVSAMGAPVATNLYLGCSAGPANQWQGYIDPEVTIEKRAMSAGEIAADFSKVKNWYGI